MAQKILIVDDDPDVVELIRLALEDSGYQVLSASNGIDALRKTQTLTPDLILLDLMLPEVNGFTICERLRTERATAQVPILILTALPGHFPRLAGMEAGANDFLNKPFTIETLLSKVDLLLTQACPALEDFPVSARHQRDIAAV
jgi:DNA-binding response OmpR family regulator